MKRQSLQRRLAALVAQHELPAPLVAPLAALLEALQDPEAPTSIHRPSDAVDVHIADALAARSVPELVQAGRVADLGAGAGIPGLPLAAASPTTRFSLVDSNARKCSFVRQTVDAMGLDNVEVIHSRVEDWGEGAATQDVVCARALGPLPLLVEYAAPLLRLDGVLIAWKGDVGESEAADGDAAAAQVGCEPSQIVSVTPFPGSQHRTLYVFRKVAETPPRYPRRAGIAAKRPLTAQTLRQ